MKKLYIIDGNAYIHRAYHALPPLSDRKGRPVNALFGFIRMVLKLIKNEQPEYLVAVFDTPAPTFRHKIFPEYKATRKKSPDDLKSQIPLSRDFAVAAGIPELEMPGYEADDIIASLARQYSGKGFEVKIISGDKDILQLVSEKVSVLNELKNILFTPEEVKKKYGFGPEKITDYLALMGDASDNVPGVPGVGEKTAVKLLSEYGGIKEIYSHLERIPGSLKSKLESGRESAVLSLELVILKKDLDLGTAADNLSLGDIRTTVLKEFLLSFGFDSLVKELYGDEGAGKPELMKGRFTLIDSPEKLNALLLSPEFKNSEIAAIDTETTSLDISSVQIIGFSVAFSPVLAYYIHFSRDFSFKDARKFLDKLYEKKLIGHNLKYDYRVLKKMGFPPGKLYFDTMIAAYLALEENRPLSLKSLVREFLGASIPEYEEVFGKKNNDLLDILPSPEKISEYACRDAAGTFGLYEIFEKKINGEKLVPSRPEGRDPDSSRDHGTPAGLVPPGTPAGLEKLFFETEMPLIRILADMEDAGIRVDREFLKNFSIELGEGISGVEKEIYALAGTEFNLNSPKQLAEILFTKLGLPVTARTKTGPSTAEEVLLNLAPRHRVPEKILEYRELVKLKNTYVDSLLELSAKSADGRIHTSFNQAVAATGRLSSSAPNLQNIPVKTALGRKTRKAFTAEEGCLLVSFDYSQIDLRSLAHISGDKNLTEYFRRNVDIHRKTAAVIFSVGEDEVTPDQRRAGKTINFAVVYGKTPYGLSRDLDISLDEAKKFIDNFFAEYPGVQEYTKKTAERVAAQGFVETVYGRKRYFPELKGKGRKDGGQLLRMAVNAPIQGTSADIIKVAMVKSDEYLLSKGLKTRLLLSVHDELLFETPEKELKTVIRDIKKIMEEACLLSVPLVCDVKSGRNWLEMKEL